MEKRNTAKTALVTGASRGIGKGIALAMAAQGYDVAITHYDEKEEAEQVAHSIESDYGRACAVFQGNLAEADTAGRFVEQTVNRFGKIDALVNNAGVTILSKMTDMSLTDIDYLLHLNFRAPLLAMQAAARHMIAGNLRGSIVNITSTRGERAYPLDAVYGGVKAALARASQSIALELAPHGIRVNCVAPGATMVRDHRPFYDALGRKIPLGRMGTPSDVAQAVVWLLSDQASYVTGATIRVDGGLILPGMPEDISPEAGYGWGKIK